MFKKILIANRGEIALRIIWACKELGIRTVAVHSDVDKDSLHVKFADEDVCIGPARNIDSYLNISRIISAAEITDADAIHPGYGFLSQNAAFAEACAAAGVEFIGPSPEAMRRLGDKRSSRRAAEESGLPVIPGASVADTVDDAAQAAEVAGFPVLLKAAGGGGGKGMRKVERAADLEAAFASARREAEAAFADGRLLVERFIAPARHVEVQVLGDGAAVTHLWERECTLQRRHQKLVEIAPSPSVSPDLRARRTREDLVADDRGRAAPLADLGGEPVPRPDGLALEPAPRQPHQVEGGQEVRVEPVGGIEDAVLAEQALVLEEHVLEVRRPGLGGADVEDHLPRHAVLPTSARSSSSTRTARSSVACGAGPTPVPAGADHRGTRASRSPWTA